MIGRLRDAARRLRLEVDALALARRDPRVPTAARVVIALTVAYALSPIDLIPDVIPVVGLLDDLVLVPLGLWLALRLVPPAVMAEARAHARRQPPQAGRLGRLGVGLVLGVWVGMAAVAWALWA